MRSKIITDFLDLRCHVSKECSRAIGASVVVKPYVIGVGFPYGFIEKLTNRSQAIGLVADKGSVEHTIVSY